jgi:hypothetical protein
VWSARGQVLVGVPVEVTRGDGASVLVAGLHAAGALGPLPEAETGQTTPAGSPVAPGTVSFHPFFFGNRLGLAVTEGFCRTQRGLAQDKSDSSRLRPCASGGRTPMTNPSAPARVGGRVSRVAAPRFPCMSTIGAPDFSQRP